MLAALYRRRHVILAVILLALTVLFLEIFRKDNRAFRVLSLLGIHSFSDHTTSYFPPSRNGCPAKDLDDIPLPPIPAQLRRGGDVQVVMKTGIGEKHLTETFLKTYGRVVDQNVLIVSDAEYDIGHHKTIDILAELPLSYALNNSDWSAYIAQHEALANGETIGKTHGGWKLDRFKFLPMVEKAHALHPTAKWYVFIEADIYYFFDGLLRLLSTLDASQPHYLGAHTPGAHGVWFAYGGGGTILSGRLVRDLMRKGGVVEDKLSTKYETMVKDDCCGDAVLAYVIYRELGVRLESLYPTLSGEDVHWLKVTPEKFCVPLVGVHRVGREGMRRLWGWERCRAYDEGAVMYSTVLDFVLKPLIEGRGNPRVGWNNGAADRLPEGDSGHESVKACEIACADDDTCVQYRYVEGVCHLAEFVMAGAEEQDKEKESVSGWDVEALERMGYDPIKGSGVSCRETKWSIPKVP